MLVIRNRFNLRTALFLLTLSTHPFGRAQDQSQSPNKGVIYGTVFDQVETLLNEQRFDKYHIFGTTSRILPGFVEVPNDK